MTMDCFLECHSIDGESLGGQSDVLPHWESPAVQRFSNAEVI